MNKLIEAARKLDEAYGLWIMTFDVLKSEVEEMIRDMDGLI